MCPGGTGYELIQSRFHVVFVSIFLLQRVTEASALVQTKGLARTWFERSEEATTEIPNINAAVVYVHDIVKFAKFLKQTEQFQLWKRLGNIINEIEEVIETDVAPDPF